VEIHPKRTTTLEYPEYPVGKHFHTWLKNCSRI